MIVRAEQIAVGQQDALALERGDDGVRQQCPTGATLETRAQQKIPIALHHEKRCARLGEITQCIADTRFHGIAVVVADPMLEQIPEDVEGLRGAGLVTEETQESVHRSRMVGVEVQVRDEEDAHDRDCRGNIMRMSSRPLVTRFAPSPSGELHLGNARTALFNFLLARRTGGRFLLRIEDTDASRSTSAFTLQLLEDLQWLGLAWDGEVVYQSARAGIYREALERLDRAGRVYPCYCSPLEIEVSRKAQLAAGRPPRYAGTCRHLDEDARFARIAEGRKPTLRFRVPDDGRIEFVDLVHGEQVFECATIGDFILQRADGSAAFFFSNLVDDVSMGVTTVLRGEDHLSNTPRQLLLAMALDCQAPTYGHLSLITGGDGAPLSKRSGARSLRQLREAGYRPETLANHLFRLGHSSEFTNFGSLDELAAAFDVERLGRSPARFDPVQLDTWQKEAIHRLSDEALEQWLAPLWPIAVSPAQRRAFVTAVRANLVLPADASLWMQVVFGEAPEPDEAGRAILQEAGGAFFRAASDSIATVGTDWKALVAAVRAATGRSGPALFRPLRLALTGVAHGPELAMLLPLITAERARVRLQRWAGA